MCYGDRRQMASRRRDQISWCRCQWSVVTLTAIALVVYHTVANIWLLRPSSCPMQLHSAASTPATCEPCLDTVPNEPLEDDPLAKIDLRLGRWDNSRSYKLFDNAAVGDLYSAVTAENKVCLATQSSIERLHELLKIAAHWSGPISVAVFVAAEELSLLRAFTVWMLRCQPEVYSRMVLHFAMPAEKPGVLDAVPNFVKGCGSQPVSIGERKPSTATWRSIHPYPQNHLRNLARKNCHSPYVFLVDIDIIPSRGMASALNKFLTKPPRCPLCAYVIPTYELGVANYPNNKSELIRLSKKRLAIPFHKKVFVYNQYASNFSRWEASDGNESSETHVSHNVTNFELFYEPFYVAPDVVPPHDERFLGYGFTRNTQLLETILDDISTSQCNKMMERILRILLVYCVFSVADFQDTQEDDTNDIEDGAVTEGDNQEIDLESVCPELSGQIIGGVASSIVRHPYQVSMVLNGNSFCGGFIISQDYVMTAAHCVRGVSPRAIRLRVGSTRRDTGGRIAAVSNVIVHPRYGQPQFDNDIAVLRLARPLTFTRSIRAIRLPQRGQQVPLARLTVTGWGLTVPGGRRIPRVMMAARVPVVPHWLCRLSYADALTNNMFCGGHFLIGGVSSCQVYEMYLVGYQFQVLSPVFTVHWGLQNRRSRPLWREKQNTKNRNHFETFKRELFARYRKDPLHLMRRPPPKTGKKSA